MGTTTSEARDSRRDVRSLTEALQDPFDPSEVHFKPGAVSGNRALALAYVDARAIQDRLDEVLGVEGWQDDYECLADGSVVCRLRLRLGDEWVTKVDVGGPSEQPGGGDRIKAAFSDALKRAAVKFGIGRYLYRLPTLWADYDPKKRQFVRPPALPAFALPAKDRVAEPASKRAGSDSGSRELPGFGNGAAKAEHRRMPADGKELFDRLARYDARLAAKGLCQRGELLKAVSEAGDRAGHGADIESWSGAAIELAVEEARQFEARARDAGGGHKDVA